MVLLSLVEVVDAKGGFLHNIPSELVSYGGQFEVLNEYQLDNTNTFLSDFGGALVGAISS
ncbi:hypothetical protein BH23THE1_BH23THE1_29080 [soil metagenome]